MIITCRSCPAQIVYGGRVRAGEIAAAFGWSAAQRGFACVRCAAPARPPVALRELQGMTHELADRLGVGGG